MKQVFVKNFVFCIIILALVGIFVMLPQESGSSAVVTLPGDEQVIIPLDEDKQYDFTAGKYTVHLLVEDGSIRFVDSECPDHLCEEFGKLSMDNEQASCLPAGVTVVVTQ